MTRPTAARRTIAALALAPLLLIGVAACGDDSGGSGSDAKDPAAGSAVLASLQKGDTVDPDKFVDTVSDGVKKSTTAHLEMKVSSGAELATDASGDLDYTTTPPSMKMTMKVPMAGESDMILSDGIFYMKIGSMSGGKYWKIDPSEKGGMLDGMGLDKMLDQSDPLGSLESLKSGIDKVTFEGNEQVGDRDLDHYKLTIDMQAVLTSLGSKLPAGSTDAMPKSVTYDLWLDDQDRFAQMKMAYPLMGQQFSMEMVVDDWGKDVSIEAPPADEVTKMPDLGSLAPTALPSA
jgi:LppX/LprAFG-like lipoprotein